MFSDERIVFQYQHNYWRLPSYFDQTSAIHTSEERADLFVRDFDSFFRQFDRRSGSFGGVNGALASSDRRLSVYNTTLCYRIKRMLIKRLRSKCVIM